MVRLFHVSSAVNRESILAHGLDWTRMGSALADWPQAEPTPAAPRRRLKKKQA
jgi:hypothetical protein